MDKKQYVKDYLSGKKTDRELNGIIIDGCSDSNPEINDADFIIYKTEGMYVRPLDSYPEIHCEKDLRRMLPLVDYDPFFDRISADGRQIRQKYGDDIFIFFEISSPLTILMNHLYGSNRLESVPQYMKDNPYSFLLALDTICVDCLNAATRVILEGKMDGVYFNCFNSKVFDDSDFEKFIKPVETHFFDEVNVLTINTILSIGNANNPDNELKYYIDYPARVFMNEYENEEILHTVFSNRIIMKTDNENAVKTERFF